jgi:uncharacterized membrane protein HdeD (DUF308 family)
MTDVIHLNIAQTWWAILLRGIAAIIFAVVAFVMPGITLQVLVLLFGAYALVDGVFALIGASHVSHNDKRWGTLMLEGVIGIVIGALAFFWPGRTVVALIYLIAAWAITTGVLEVMAAIRLRRHVAGEWLLALSGIFSVLFGLALAFVPFVGEIVIAVWIGVYALMTGAVLIALSLRLRRHRVRLMRSPLEASTAP